MTPFESSLADEPRYLAHIVNQPMPTNSRSGHRTYIGPTIWLSLGHSLVTDKETLLISAWKNQKAWKW